MLNIGPAMCVLNKRISLFGSRIHSWGKRKCSGCVWLLETHNHKLLLCKRSSERKCRCIWVLAALLYRWHSMMHAHSSVWCGCPMLRPSARPPPPLKTPEALFLPISARVMGRVVKMLLCGPGESHAHTHVCTGAPS